MARPWLRHSLLFVLFGVASPLAAAEDTDPPESEQPQKPLVPVGEVAITATRSERSVLETAGNVTVIDREAIEQSGARDVPELLRREAGIFVVNTTTNPDGYQIDGRGFNDGGGNGSSLLVLVNGRRFNDADTSSPDWSLLRLGNVERIEVIRGPASALYGDGAVSGVIHVVTRSAEGPVEVELRGESGTYDTTLGQAFVRGREGPLSGSLFFDRPSTDGYRDQAGFRAERVEGTLRLELGERVVLGLDTGFSSDERNRPGAISKAIIDHSDPRCEIDFPCGRRVANPGVEGDRLTRRRFHADGLASVTLSEEVALELRPFYRRVSSGGTITNPATPEPFVSTQDVVSYSLGLGTQLVVETPVAGFANRMIVGFDLLGEDVDVDSVFTPSFPGSDAEDDTTRHLYGVYLQDEIDLTPRLLLSLGTRYDYARVRGEDQLALPDEPSTFRFKDTFWSPKGALVYRLSDTVSTYASYARAFRVPNIDEAFGFFGFNEGLDAETSDSYEVGLKARELALPGDMEASWNLAFYWMNVDDQILFDHEIPSSFEIDPNGPQSIDCLPSSFGGPCNVNIDRVRHRGVETSANLLFDSWLELYGSYTYDDTEIRSDSIFRFRESAGCPDPAQPCLISLKGNQLPVTPRHRGTLGFWLHLPHSIDVGLNANYVGSRYAVNDLENQFSKLSKYATYDARIAWRPKVSEQLDLELGLMLRNLFDREYSAFGGERTFARGEPYGFNPSPGRTWQVSVGLRWGP
jgi:iron complex outermembrane receptor protein